MDLDFNGFDLGDKGEVWQHEKVNIQHHVIHIAL